MWREGQGLPRLPTDCKGPQCRHKKTILHTQTNTDFASTIWKKNPIDTSGELWILDQFQGPR